MQDSLKGTTIGKYAIRVMCVKTHRIMDDKLNTIGEILEGTNGLLLCTGIKYPVKKEHYTKKSWTPREPEDAGFIIWDKNVLQIPFHIPPGPKESCKHSWTPASLYEKTGEKDGGAFCSNCNLPAVLGFYGIRCLNECGENK